jgi:hypothetical protein
MLDSQRFEFFGNALPIIAFTGPGEHDDLHYAFPIAYQNTKASGR